MQVQLADNQTTTTKTQPAVCWLGLIGATVNNTKQGNNNDDDRLSELLPQQKTGSFCGGRQVFELLFAQICVFDSFVERRADATVF